MILFTGVQLQAQSSLIQVVDSTTLSPISFATITTPNTYFYTDLEGRFDRQKIKDKKYEVRCIGYSSYQSATVSDTIFLQPSNYLLEEVAVTAYQEKFDVGYHELNSYGNQSGAVSDISAVYIPAPPQEALIESILLSFKSISKGSVLVVYLFEALSNSYPGDLISQQTITHQSRKRTVVVELGESKIPIPNNGIVVGFRRLEHPKGKKAPVLNMTKSLKENRSFYFYQNSWKKTSISSIPFWNYKLGLRLTPY